MIDKQEVKEEILNGIILKYGIQDNLRLEPYLNETVNILVDSFNKELLKINNKNNAPLFIKVGKDSYYNVNDFLYFKIANSMHVGEKILVCFLKCNNTGAFQSAYKDLIELNDLINNLVNNYGYFRQEINILDHYNEYREELVYININKLNNIWITDKSGIKQIMFNFDNGGGIISDVLNEKEIDNFINKINVYKRDNKSICNNRLQILGIQ